MKTLFRNIFLLFTCWALYGNLTAQPWVDTTYQVVVHKDIVYGTAVNFAGKIDTLKMDIYLPVNDEAPACGRPVFMGIHGGGWYAGHKGEGVMKSMAVDFAKRGYVGVSINYRLGLFNTHQSVHCNISGWDCWNMADTAEWYRANYRGMLDAKQALIYLAENSETYHLNANNVFLAGESAGGFIAMGLGFIDHEDEILHSLIDSVAAVKPPHPVYGAACLNEYGLAESIADMDTIRSALPPLLSPEDTPFKIRGVGNFYGGTFHNIFKSHVENPPVLYMFHQPCDLLVPYSHDKILEGFSGCLQQFPANCEAIINRPYIYGSKGIQTLIDNLEDEGTETIDYMFSSTNYNYNCFQQLDPSLGCHAIDNYEFRTHEMALYFSDFIQVCNASALHEATANHDVKLWPNPAREILKISAPKTFLDAEVQIFDVSGRKVIHIEPYQNGKPIGLTRLNAGMYFVEVKTKEFKVTLTFIKEN